MCSRWALGQGQGQCPNPATIRGLRTEERGHQWESGVMRYENNTDHYIRVHETPGGLYGGDADRTKVNNLK